MSFGKAGVTCGLLVIMIGGGSIWAAEERKTLQLAARIQPRASLSLDRTQITFAGMEDQRIILSQEGPVQVTVKVRASASRSTTLNMRAESDLEGLGGSIPIQQVEWTAKGRGTGRGALSRTNEQTVGRWTTSGIHQTQLQFVLKNNGNLSPGEYQTFVNFTLSFP